MKRPVSHILVPLACLFMLPFCLQPGSALGVEKTRNHAAGKFQLDVGSNDAGWIMSTEGGLAESEVVQEKLGPVPAHKALAQPLGNRDIRPQQPPKLAEPVCPHPPCGLGNARANQQRPLGDVQKKPEDLQDKKDEQAETSEDQQRRLQEAQDRQTRSDAAASNAIKKHSETSGAIISNFK